MKIFRKLTILIFVMLISIYSIFYFVNWYVAGLVDQVKLIEYNMVEDIRYCQKWRPELLNRDAKITYYIPDWGKWVCVNWIRVNWIHEHPPTSWEYVTVSPDPRIPDFNALGINQSLAYGKKMPIHIPPRAYPTQPIKKQMTLFEWTYKYNPELANELKLKSIQGKN